MPLNIKFGTIAGQFELEVQHNSGRKAASFHAYPDSTIPVSWGLDVGDDFTEQELEELREMLEKCTRIFDKKVSEAMGHFMTQRRVRNQG